MLPLDKSKIYCAGAIRGDTSYREGYDYIVKIVGQYFDPRTEIAQSYATLEDFADDDDRDTDKSYVNKRDLKWLGESLALVAEFSGSSSGVGGELVYAAFVKRIPCLLLYKKDSKPSLMIIKWETRYIIAEEYADFEDLEFFVRCFLEAIEHCKKSNIRDIEEVRNKYFYARDQCPPDCRNKKGEVRSLLEQKEKPRLKRLTQEPLDLDLDYPVFFGAEKKRVDFKDLGTAVEFLFLSALFQDRWGELRSQRIGRTFVSGRKSQIILNLTQGNVADTFGTIYEKVNQAAGYSKTAFMKNLRALRRVGVLKSPERLIPDQGHGTKFKENVYLVRGLDNEMQIHSSRGDHVTRKGIYLPTVYLYSLVRFLEIFGSRILERVLTQEWVKRVNAPEYFDGDFSLEGLLKDDNLVVQWKSVSKDVERGAKEIWSEHYTPRKP